MPGRATTSSAFAVEVESDSFGIEAYDFWLWVQRVGILPITVKLATKEKFIGTFQAKDRQQIEGWLILQRIELVSDT
jgi:hypothetical protein